MSDLMKQVIAAIPAAEIISMVPTFAKIRRKADPSVELSAHIVDIRTADGHRHIVVSLEASK